MYCVTDIAFVATCETELSTAVTQKTDNSFQRFLDSGASDHMVRDRSYFEELHRLPREISIAVAKSGQSLTTIYGGTIRTCTEVERRMISSIVEEVLYVSGLNLNLFSISRLEDEGMLIILRAEK